MKTIEIYIKDSGEITCYLKKGELSKRELYRNILNEVKELSLGNNAIKISDSIMKFKNNQTEVKIINYKNNRDISLDTIIEKIYKDKIRQRREYLKKQKVKRVKTITYTVVLSLTVLTSALINLTQAKSNENIKNQEVAIVETYDDNNYEIFKEEYNDINDAVENEINYDENKQTIDLEFEDRTDTEKYRITKAYYENFITQIANEYGVDPGIMLAIATQESGLHNIEQRGPAIGLMQIERAVWDNQSITAYNYVKNSFETLNISEQKLKDLEFNVRVACMHLQNCLKNSNYNLSAAIQMYNFGYGNIEKTYKLYYGENADLRNLSFDCDNDWLAYRDYIAEGDNRYLEHILSYVEHIDNIKCKNNNEIIHYEVNNLANTKRL